MRVMRVWVSLLLLAAGSAEAVGQERAIDPLSGEAGCDHRSAAANMVNQATGAVAYSVPLTTVTEGQLTVPITAS